MFDSKYHFSLDINPQGININPSSITREGVSQGSYLCGEVHTFYYGLYCKPNPSKYVTCVFSPQHSN